MAVLVYIFTVICLSDARGKTLFIFNKFSRQIEELLNAVSQKVIFAVAAKLFE